MCVGGGGGKEKMMVTSIFSFSHNVFNSLHFRWNLDQCVEENAEPSYPSAVTGGVICIKLIHNRKLIDAAVWQNIISSPDKKKYENICIRQSTCGLSGTNVREGKLTDCMML